jgi:transposase
VIICYDGSGMPRIAPAIALDAQTKGKLEHLARAPSTPQARALRARIVLAAAQGLSNQQIAAQFHLSVNTVGIWRSRFAKFGLDGLKDDQRGRPRKYGPRVREKLQRLLRRLPPQGRKRWTVDGLARELHMPRSSVYELLLETGSKSRRLPARRVPRF